MNDWIIWLALAGAVVILEVFTGTFYLLMISFGLAAGALAALVGLGVALQFVTAAIVGMAATYGLRKSKYGKMSRTNAAQDPNVNIDIGQTLAIDEWKTNTGGESTARVMYSGAMWDVQLAPDATAKPGSFTIVEIRGSRLIVSDHINNNN